MNTIKANIKDKDMINVEIALKRAAKKARMLAKQTNTPLIVYEGGKVVKKYFKKKSQK